MPKARCLIVTPSLRAGGAERTLINLLQWLKEDAEGIVLLIGAPGGALENEVPACVRRIYLFRNPFFGRLCFWLFRRRLFTAPLRLVWSFKVRGEFESVICFQDSFFTDLVATFNRTKKRAAVVHANYEADTNFARSLLDHRSKSDLLERRYARLDTLAFVSKSSKKAFERSIGTLPNGVVLPILFCPEQIRRQAALVSAAKEEVGTGKPVPVESHSTFQFACVGSLLPVKGHDLLLDACEILKNQGLRFHLHLVGDGVLKQELTEQVTKLGLSDHVTMHGFLKNPYPLLSTADAMVLPSVSEAMPTVICEAHVLGVPVLASDCEGCRDILGDGKYGLIFKRNEKALANAMQSFVESPELAAGWRRKGQAWLETYDKDEVLNGYRALMGFKALTTRPVRQNEKGEG